MENVMNTQNINEITEIFIEIHSQYHRRGSTSKEAAEKAHQGKLATGFGFEISPRTFEFCWPQMCYTFLFYFSIDELTYYLGIML